MYIIDILLYVFKAIQWKIDAVIQNDCSVQNRVLLESVDNELLLHEDKLIILA